MDMKFLTSVTGRSRDAINVIIKKAGLQDELPETTSGVSRQFTRSNVLKIYFLSAALNAMGTIEGALPLAMRWVELERKGKLPRFYSRNPVSGYDNEYDQLVPIDEIILDLENQGGGGFIDDEETKPFIPANELQIISLRTMVDFIDAHYRRIREAG